MGEFIDFAGVTATAAALANKATLPFTVPPVNLASNLVFFDGVGDASALANAVTASNHCWTAAIGHPAATGTLRAVIGGYIGSITTCVKHAVDGYSFWGAILLAKVGKDWVAANFATASSMLTAENAAQG